MEDEKTMMGVRRLARLGKVGLHTKGRSAASSSLSSFESVNVCSSEFIVVIDCELMFEKVCSS